MTIGRDAGQSEWICSAQRPAGVSYLFFEEFQLTVKGATLQQVTAEARRLAVSLSVSLSVYLSVCDGLSDSELLHTVFS